MDILSFNGKEIWRGSSRQRLKLDSNERFIGILAEHWPEVASNALSLDALTTCDVRDDSRSLTWQFDVNTRGGAGRGQGRKPQGSEPMISAPKFMATEAQIEFCRKQPGGFSKFVRGLIDDAMKKSE